MKTYLEEQTDRVPQTEQDIFRAVRRAVNSLPDEMPLGRGPDGKVILSCHILARAVGRVFGLKCVDGFFHPTFQHSWLVTPSGNVIDVYPVGILGGPILADRIHVCRRPDEGAAGHCYGLYIPRKTRQISWGRFGDAWFKRAVATVERHLRCPGGA